MRILRLAGRLARLTSRSQAGFTLIELVIASTVALILMGVVATALVSVVGIHDTTDQRFSESRDAQIASAYLASDVQSMDAIGSSVCGSTGTAKLNLALHDGKSVTYSFLSVDGEGQLLRQTCTGTTPDGAARVLAREVVDSAAVELSCVPTTACDPGERPRSIALRITERDTTAAGRDVDQLAFSIEGSRRTTEAEDGTDTDPPEGDTPAFVATGSGSGKLNLTGNAKLTVVGTLLVDVPSSNAVINNTNNSSGIWASRFLIKDGGTCDGCTSSNTRPMPSPLVGTASDPYSGLPEPIGLTTHTGTSYQGPGRYTSRLNLNSDTNLAAGIYLLEAGVDFNNRTHTGTDVFFYVKGGDVNFGNSNTTLAGASSGTYKDLLLFQPAGNSSAISIQGNALLKGNGAIYAPGSVLGLTLASGTPTVYLMRVVATNITMTGGGGGSVTVGSVPS